MGTILHEGEYILINCKIIDKTQYTGYAILSHIGINTSKTNYLGSTTNFLTYAVIEDLELPFEISIWQDFEIRGTTFHAYTKATKNLILMEHHERIIKYTDEIHEFFEEKKKEKKEKKENMEMKFKANNYIYIATNTGAWNDDRLIEALLGYMPADREHHNITPCGFLWSKNKLLKDNWFNVDDANERLHNLDRKLKFTVTGRGDIIIYKDIYDDVSKIFEVYNKIISQENKEAKKEDLKMTIEANNYIYITCNTTGFSDCELISALLGYVPTCTKYENIHGYDLLWSRTKFLHERSFVFNDAERRLHEMDKKLDFVMTEKGDIIIYRNTNNHTLKDILDAYDKYSKRDVDNDKLRKHFVSMASDSNFSFSCQPILTMPRNLGRSQAMSMLNSIYGLNPSFQAGLLRWGDWDSGFKLYFGVERATGKQKTVCLWKDGEKTIIRGDKSVLSMPVQYAVAWCYVKRRFKTTSQFKKYVDNHSFVMDGMTYFEGDARVKGAQASTNNRTKKYDIYDAAALAITAKHYGSVKTIMTYCDGWGE